ncbi:hypothetical protein Tco_0728355 [Tanacetum coccineum]|uniref:Uncharacterized protein n=1 Tax=Tanacetum coccineum TaxID=301880 RepID=A0ABQ4YKY2_9ASTR
MANVYPNVHESLKFLADKHVILEDPLSSSGTLSSKKNLDDAYTIRDQFLNDKSTEDEPGTLNVEAEVVSMVTVPIHQASSLVPPLFTPVIDILPPKPMFESSTYRSLPEHVALYEALEASMERSKRVEFFVEKDKSRKRRQAHSSSSKQKSAPHSEQPVNDVPIPDDVNISDSEDTDTTHLLKIKSRPDWLKPALEEDRPAIPEPDWMEECHLLVTDQVDLVNPEGHRVVLDVCKPLPLGGPPGQVANYLNFGLEELVLSLWIESEREYDINGSYGISHWWFKCKEFYITRHSAPSGRSTVRSHMRILSVVNLKTYERYGYTFLKEIVLRRADYKKYKILEADFKNLHPNDFEDMYLLHLQGQLNHLFGADKVHLFNAVNLWIRNIVIRKCVEDLQLEIKSYQTKLNLTQPD